MASLPETPPVNFLHDAIVFLTKQGYQDVELVGAYSSYITGLAYCKDQPKPEQFKFYLCRPEENNRYDPNAMTVVSEEHKPIGFVPKKLTVHTGNRRPCVAFCTGKCSEKYVSCVYIIAKTGEKQTCCMCNRPASKWILPCQHYTSCDECVPKVLNQVCPICNQLVIEVRGI